MMKVLLLMSVIMSSIVSALQVKIQDLIPVLEPKHDELLLPADPFPSENEENQEYANSTTQTQIFLQQQAGAAAAAGGAGPYEQISRGKDFCRGKELWKGGTSGQSDCEHKCTANGQCKFYSFWFTGGINYCALVTDCDSYGQQNHDIVIMKKRPIWGCPAGACVNPLFKADPKSPCKTYDISEASKGNWEHICRGHINIYSARKINLGDLPVGIGFRCDHDNNWHVGFDAMGSRTSGYELPYGNTECQSGTNEVLVNWDIHFVTGGKQQASRLKLTRNTDNLMLWVNTDRTITYYVNGAKSGVTTAAIPANKFPIEFTLSDNGNPAEGVLHNLRWFLPADEDAHDSISNILTDIKKSIQNELESATATATKECTSDTKATVVVADRDVSHPDPHQKRVFKYQDLTGCAAESECETSTEAQQKIAIAAHKELWVRTAIGEDLAGQLERLRQQETAKKVEKARLEREMADNGKLHKARMAKFTHAITSLTKINEHLINTGEIKMPTLLEEEKNVIGNFKLGKVMLLMLDQASSGVKEKELVNTLKKLLSSCINSLEDSKKLEKEKHDNWVNMMQSKIKGCQDAIAGIISDKADTAAKITANDQVIANEERRKGNALATHLTERKSCLTLHKNFVEAVKNHKSEIDAIDNMVKIVNDAKLNAQTQTIRDETEKTKHGVKESVEQ